MSCIVRGCRSHSRNRENSSDYISFHTFPKRDQFRQRWFDAISRNEKQHKKTWRLCSRHFSHECFVQGNLLRPRLKEDAVPILNLPDKTAVVDFSMSHVGNEPSRTDDTLLPMPQETTTTHSIPHVVGKPNSNNATCLPTPQANATTGLLDVTMTTSTIIAVQEGRIAKLEKEIKKLELIAKKRLMELNALKQKYRRLKKKNSNINIQ